MDSQQSASSAGGVALPRWHWPAACLIAFAALVLTVPVEATPADAPSRLGPASKRAALAQYAAETFVFIVRGDAAALTLARSLATPGEEGGPARELPGLDAVAVRLRVSDAFGIASQAGVTQVWYLHPSLADVYISVLQGIEYATRTMDKPGVINMSLGPPAEVMPLIGEDDEPMNLATKRAADSGLIAVVAIGNYFEGGNRGTTNPWCRPVWVVCVGAASSDMTKLWSGSARGIAADRPSWPDMVADGIDVIGPWPTSMPKPDARKAADERNERFMKVVPEQQRDLFTVRTGTSAAVPQVVRAAAQILHFVRSVVESRGEIHAGDKLFALEIPIERADRPSRQARMASEITQRTATSVEVTYRFVEPWKVVKQLLIDTAVPMPGLAGEDIGAGFISPAYVEQQFGKFGKPDVKILPIKVVSSR